MKLWEMVTNLEKPKRAPSVFGSPGSVSLCHGPVSVVRHRRRRRCRCRPSTLAAQIVTARPTAMELGMDM